MLKQLKRAFTIVELVIVVAVIAVLAAVLIPTLSYLMSTTSTIDKAVVIALNEELENTSCSTCADALAVASSKGYDLTKIETTNGDIMWDQESNKFVIVNNGNIYYKDDATTITTNSQLWYIATSEVLSGYSVYFASLDAIENNSVSAENIGIDVSALDTAIDITYNGDNTSGDNIIVNANGGAIIINDNDAVDEIYVYGTAYTLTAKKVANASLHIFASVTGCVSVESGHVVIEESAVVENVVITASDVSAVSVTNESGSTLTVVASNENVTASLTKIVSGSTNVIEEAMDANGLLYFEKGVGTEANPYIISTCEQYVNISCIDDATRENDVYIQLAADIDFTAGYELGEYVFDLTSCTLDLNGYTVTAYNVESNYNGVAIGYYYVGVCAVIKNGNMNTYYNESTGKYASYAAFIGDGVHATFDFTLEDVKTIGGVNCFVAEMVTLKNCDVQGTRYYAVWADQGCFAFAYTSTATESWGVKIVGGTYSSNGNAVFGATSATVDGTKCPSTIEVENATISASTNRNGVFNGTLGGSLVIASTSTCDIDVTKYLV